jgi:hypothetical protein
MFYREIPGLGGCDDHEIPLPASKAVPSLTLHSLAGDDSTNADAITPPAVDR